MLLLLLWHQEADGVMAALRSNLDYCHSPDVLLLHPTQPHLLLCGGLS